MAKKGKKFRLARNFSSFPSRGNFSASSTPGHPSSSFFEYFHKLRECVEAEADSDVVIGKRTTSFSLYFHLDDNDIHNSKCSEIIIIYSHLGDEHFPFEKFSLVFVT
jgi:hypothetical protein